MEWWTALILILCSLIFLMLLRIPIAFCFLIVNLVAAGMAGAGIPLFMKSLGLDPAQSSNIILTTITDVGGFIAFLGFAVIFQDYLTSW